MPQPSPDRPVDGPGRDGRMPGWLPGAYCLALAVALGGLALLRAAQSAAGVLRILLVAVFLSFALEPAVARLAARGMRRSRATLLVLATVVCVCVLVVLALVPLLVDELRALLGAVPGWAADLSSWLDRRFGIALPAGSTGADITETRDRLSGPLSDLASGVLGFGSDLVSALFSVLSLLLFGYYLVAEGPALRRTLCSVLPTAHQQRVLWVWEVAISKTGGYLYSRIVLAAASALVTGVALSLLDVPYPVPLAVWTGLVSQFVPVIGTYLGMALPLLVAAIERPGAVLWVLVVLLAYQQLENYVIGPRITSRTMSIHPALAFGAALAGAEIAGPVGAFLALPVAAIVQALLSAAVPRQPVVDHPLTEEPAGSTEREAVTP